MRDEARLARQTGLALAGAALLLLGLSVAGLSVGIAHVATWVEIVLMVLSALAATTTAALGLSGAVAWLEGLDEELLWRQQRRLRRAARLLVVTFLATAAVATVKSAGQPSDRCCAKSCCATASSFPPGSADRARRIGPFLYVPVSPKFQLTPTLALKGLKLSFGSSKPKRGPRGHRGSRGRQGPRGHRGPPGAPAAS